MTDMVPGATSVVPVRPVVRSIGRSGRLPGLVAAFAVECGKAGRSLVLPLTFAAATIAPGIGGLFMFIVSHPDRARQIGILGQKAQLSGLSADWSGLLAFAVQVLAVGGLLLFSFVVTWVFGREFSDGTARYLMALPVSRTAIVLAKFILIALWCLAMSVWLIGLLFAVGGLMGLPGWSGAMVGSALLKALSAVLLMLPAVLPIAFAASGGHGYLAPLGAALGMLVVGQVAGVLGWGAVVPWSIPAVAAGLTPGVALGPAGIIVAVLTGVAGIGATLAWWRGGDAGL